MQSPSTAVLNRIEQSPLRPTGLLADLGSEYSYSEIQDALSDLLERGDVVLEANLTLSIAHPPENAEVK